MMLVLALAFSAMFVSYYINALSLNIIMLVAMIIFAIIYNKNSFVKIGKVLKRKFGRK